MKIDTEGMNSEKLSQTIAALKVLKAQAEVREKKFLEHRAFLRDTFGVLCLSPGTGGYTYWCVSVEKYDKYMSEAVVSAKVFQVNTIVRDMNAKMPYEGGER